MKESYEKLSLDFVQTMYGLYVVYDKTTGRDVSGVITAANDLVAVGSFVKFLEAQKEKMEPYSEFVLRVVGMFDTISLKITNGEVADILSSKEDVNEYYDGLINYYNKINEE